MPDEAPLPDAVVRALVAKARQIHDATPADHAQDHPIAPLAIQMWMLEESQRAAAEQQRAMDAAAKAQREHDREILRQNRLLVIGTYAGVAAAFLGVYVTWAATRGTSINRVQETVKVIESPTKYSDPGDKAGMDREVDRELERRKEIYRFLLSSAEAKTIPEKVSGGSVTKTEARAALQKLIPKSLGSLPPGGEDGDWEKTLNRFEAKNK